MSAHYQLIKDVLNGKPSAQRALYEEFAPIMLGVCYRYTKSMTDAEDVLQDGFIKVFRFLHQYKMEGELGAWIRRIMVTTSINYLKKNARYQYDLFNSEGFELQIVTDDNPGVLMNIKELAALIRQLPSGYQTVFNLHAVEGYSHVEISKLLGISEGTSRSQYSRARTLLINWIEQQSVTPKLVSYVK
jgi:RNA polymerase sigma-70 factor (ECF subfamily)